MSEGRFKAQWTRHKIQGTRNKIQGTRHKIQGTRNKEQGKKGKNLLERGWFYIFKLLLFWRVFHFVLSFSLFFPAVWILFALMPYGSSRADGPLFLGCWYGLTLG
jgi:hypothetical protein